MTVTSFVSVGGGNGLASGRPHRPGPVATPRPAGGRGRLRSRTAHSGGGVGGGARNVQYRPAVRVPSSVRRTASRPRLRTNRTARGGTRGPRASSARGAPRAAASCGSPARSKAGSPAVRSTASGVPKTGLPLRVMPGATLLTVIPPWARVLREARGGPLVLLRHVLLLHGQAVFQGATSPSSGYRSEGVPGRRLHGGGGRRQALAHGQDGADHIHRSGPGAESADHGLGRGAAPRERNEDGSERVMPRAAVRPSPSRLQEFLTPVPPGDGIPAPVVTTRRPTAGGLPSYRCDGVSFCGRPVVEAGRRRTGRGPPGERVVSKTSTVRAVKPSPRDSPLRSARRSRTMTSTPTSRGSPAGIMPAGPAPATTTAASIYLSSAIARFPSQGADRRRTCGRACGCPRLWKSGEDR